MASLSPTLHNDEGPSHAARVTQLLSEMTLEEKLAQLGSRWSFELIHDRGFSAEHAAELMPHGIGQITRLSGATDLEPAAVAHVANEIQRYLVEETRLSIPAIVHEEICSGLMAPHSVVFPQAINLASTWDPALAEALGDAIRVEMRARGAHQGLGPVLDIARDPRWGRMEETFGEDPQLVADMGVAFVHGLQGRDLATGVIATGKHLYGYGASEGGMNWAPVSLGARETEEVYLFPFEATIAAGLASIMHAYVEVDGVPCAANKELLTNILRERWGFDGIVVSDYFGVRQLVDYHAFAVDATEAAAKAINAGVDVELPSTDCYGKGLAEAIKSGAIDLAVVDNAVSRVLNAKFALGLFDNPYVEPEKASSRRRAHRELARHIARQSIVLLRNNGILPLQSPEASYAVIGPNAASARNLFGDYTYVAHVELLEEARMNGDKNIFDIPIPDGTFAANRQEVATILDAVRDQLGVDRVRFATGCDVLDSPRDGFDEAVALAASSDVAILVMGDKAGLTDDCTSGEGRDRVSLDLPGVQEELVRAVINTGTPVVLVLVAGRPLGSPWIHEHSAAVITAWLPGEAGAQAVAQVLSGAISPSGKLPLSYPRSAGQVPVFYRHKPSGGRSHWKGDYVDSPVSPLYPFGHGLTYAHLALEEIELDTSLINSGSVEVSAVVTNEGSRDGANVLQLYVRTSRTSVTRPVRELKGYQRLEVATGTATRVTFVLSLAQLAFLDDQMRLAVEPCDVEVFVGFSVDGAVSAGMFSIPEAMSTTAARRSFAPGSVVVTSLER